MFTANKGGYNFPKRGDEYWKFTRPDQFIAISKQASQVQQVAQGKRTGTKPLVRDILQGIANIRINCQPGKIQFDETDDRLTNLLEVGQTSQAKDNVSWVKDMAGGIESRLQQPIPRPLAKYCIANSQEGICLWAKGEITDPIFLHYGNEFAGGNYLLHNLVRVSPGAKLTLVEIGTPWAGVNQVNEVHVEPGGNFNHIRVTYENPAAQILSHQFARVDERASLKSFSLNGNSPLTRNEHVIELPEDNANAHVSGVFVGTGKVAHDDTVFIRHVGLNGTSRQVFRKVLNKGATGVFQGKIHVNPGSQKTDGYQKSQALLLDETSQFLVKPELEIYADDVSCSHGSTCGSIDANALYYLRSRGINKEEAIAMLSLGFLKEVLTEIDNEEITASLEELLTNMVNDAI